MELLHAEKLRKQQKELEQAEMDVVSTHTHTFEFLLLYWVTDCPLHSTGRVRVLP
jgi:hypothetical protein